MATVSHIFLFGLLILIRYDNKRNDMKLVTRHRSNGQQACSARRTTDETDNFRIALSA